MESIGDTVMKHGQPSLGERGDAWERFSCIQEPPCIGEQCSISHYYCTGRSRVVLFVGDPF